MIQFTKAIFSGVVAAMCALGMSSPAQAFDPVRTQIDFPAKGIDSSSNRETTGVLHLDLFNGGGPLNGTVDLPKGSGGIAPGTLHGIPNGGISVGNEFVSAATITYTDSIVTGFRFEYTGSGASPNPVTILSVQLTENGGEIRYNYRPGGGGETETYSVKYEPFDLSKMRYEYWNHNSGTGFCSAGLTIDFPQFKQSNTPGCFHMETKSKQYCWVDANPAYNTLALCQAQDSCDGGGGKSSGGCYKWAQTYAAPRQSWK